MYKNNQQRACQNTPYFTKDKHHGNKRPKNFQKNRSKNKTYQCKTQNDKRRHKIMMKILLIISIITGAISAVVEYFSNDDTQAKIEQVKDK